MEELDNIQIPLVRSNAYRSAFKFIWYEIHVGPTIQKELHYIIVFVFSSDK